jgi:two-component system, NtrC family, response regulator AtoC
MAAPPRQPADFTPTVRTAHDPDVPPRRALMVIAGDAVEVHALPEAGEVTIGRGSGAAIAVDHPTLSRTHLALRLGPGIEAVDLGSANGTLLRGNRLPAHTPVEIAPYETLQVGDVALVVQEVRAPAAAAPAIARPSGPVDASRAAAPLLADAAMRRLYDVAARVARGTIGVLVVGETGAGKEVLAEAVHRGSPRAARPLVRINCAALTESLVESELFGHERGAFTGAVQPRAGLIEAADGGTVFLDEVGELSPAVQAKLLRVVEDRRVTRVGATDARAVDVRFVAATNRDLGADVEAGGFRRDLYFRLAGVVLAVPPLRARPDEIEPLARAFVAEAAARIGAPPPALTDGALAALRAHAWPGNVRELRAAMERAVLVADGPIDVAALGLGQGAAPPGAPAPASAAPAAPAAAPLADELADLERRRIVGALEQCGGNQTRAAELLGMPRRTLVKRLARYGIKRPRGG